MSLIPNHLLTPPWVAAFHRGMLGLPATWQPNTSSNSGIPPWKKKESVFSETSRYCPSVRLLSTLPGCASPSHGVFAGLSPNCRCWRPESCLADLECPSGITKPGGSPGLWRASKVLPGTIGRKGDVQKGQKVGQFPVSLPGGSLFYPPSAGL